MLKMLILLFLIFSVCLFQSPKCWRGGEWFEEPQICECPIHWEGSKCEKKSCKFGTGLNDLNTCTGCVDKGWGGANCDICLTDNACYKQNNDHKACLKGLIPFRNMHFSCEINDLIFREHFGNTSTFQCKNVGYGVQGDAEDGEEVPKGECFFQLWTYDSKLHQKGFLSEFMWCNFYDCSYTRKSNEINYECLNSYCDCNMEDDYGAKDLCKEYREEVILKMRGKGGVSCNLGNGNSNNEFCVFYHANFGLPNIGMKCIGGECVDEHFVAPDAPPNTILFTFVGVIFSFSSLFVVIIIILIIVDMFFRIASKREYAQLQKKKICGVELTCSNVNYFINVWKKNNCWFAKSQILKNFSYTFMPGTLTAVMGETGAGKTSLLDILAGRNKSGKITGKVLYNGKRLDSSFKRLTGYVMGEDVLISTLTVRECIEFAADLRIPTSVSPEKKRSMVNDVMKQLNIHHISNHRIGDGMKRGISGGERKRVSIACELVVSPHLLILDEVTTGLDSSTAYSIISLLSNIAKTKGSTIIFSIHQPRKIIFEKFDNLVVIHNGVAEFHGPVKNVVKFFQEKTGLKMPSNDNPADWLVDVIGKMKKNAIKTVNDEKANGYSTSSSSMSESDSSFSSSESESERESESESEIESEIESESETVTDSDEEGVKIVNKVPIEVFDEKLIRCATPFLHQLWVLIVKDFKIFLRNFYLMPLHFTTAILMGFLLGILYYKSELDLSGSHNRMGAIFFAMTILAFTAMSGIGVFIKERPLYVREQASGYYYAFTYWLSKILLDIIPLRIFPTIIMCSIFYFMIGLRSVPYFSFVVFFGIMIMFNIISGLICIVIGTISPTVSSANIITTIVILLSSVFSGFLLNKTSLSSSMYWLVYLSYWSYSYEALIVNEFTDVKILINPQNLPSYLVDGKFILDEFGMNADMFIVDFVVLSVFVASLCVISGIILQFFVKEKR